MTDRRPTCTLSYSAPAKSDGVHDSKCEPTGAIGDLADSARSCIDLDSPGSTRNSVEVAQEAYPPQPPPDPTARSQPTLEPGVPIRRDDRCRRFRILAIVDDSTRECLALVADSSLPGLRVARELDAVIAIRSCPAMIVLTTAGADQHDNATLVTGPPGRVVLHCTRQPQQNAFIESFNGRLRDELLNETLFSSLAHAREVPSLWKNDYNTVRPHTGLGNLTPVAYANHSAPDNRAGCRHRQ